MRFDTIEEAEISMTEQWQKSGTLRPLFTRTRGGDAHMNGYKLYNFIDTKTGDEYYYWR